MYFNFAKETPPATSLHYSVHVDVQVRTSDIRVCKTVRGDGGRGADGGDTRDTAALLLYNYTSAPHRASQPPPGAAYTSPSIMRILYAV